jgi:hypothetical protein
MASKFVGLLGNTGLFKWASKSLTPVSRLFSIISGSSATLSEGIDMWSKTLSNTEKLNMTLIGSGGLIVSYGLLKDAMKRVSEEGWTMTSVLETGIGLMGNVGSGALIGSQFGAIGAAIGGVTGALLGLYETYMNYPTESTKVIDAVSKQTEETRKYLDTLEAEQQAIQGQLNANLIRTGIHKSYLEELDKLVDADGKVKKGQEDRVKFILSELKDAYGIEIEMVGEVIEKYEDQKKKIKEVIEQQEMQYLLDANREAYMKAQENEVKLYKESKIALENYNKASEARVEAEEKLMNTSELNILAYYKRYKAWQDAQKKEREAREEYERSTKAYKDNVLIQNRYTELKTAVLSGETEKIREAIEKYKNSYVENGEIIQESSGETVQRQVENWGILLDEYKKTNKSKYDELINSLANETKAVEDITPEQASKWALLGEQDKEAFITAFQKLNPEIQQKVIDKMYKHGFSISEELQRGISSITPTIKFKTSLDDVKTAVNGLITQLNKSPLSNLFGGVKIPTFKFKANGGFMEDGWFRASKGELMGKFDDGTSIVANNRQVVAGVREMLKDGMMDALVMANNSGGNKSKTQVTIVAEDNDLLNGIKFKEKQRDRQFGY